MGCTGRPVLRPRKPTAASRTRCSLARAAPAGKMVQTHVDIVKSPHDKKQYRRIDLDNGLKVLLIHDPDIAQQLLAGEQAEAAGKDRPHDMHAEQDEGEDDDSGEEGEEEEEMGEGEEDGSEETGEDDTGDEGEEGIGEDDEEEDGGRPGGGGSKKVQTKKAAAAMAVGVGSFSDPPHLPGLSHYLEHMLFMGSDKYPDENEYDAFLTRHGGSSNAFTELEFTNYHFDVQPEALRGALDRFAQFFISPLCLADSMEREVRRSGRDGRGGGGGLMRAGEGGA